MTADSSGSDATAYVTVLSTDSYLAGVLALNESLRVCRSAHPLYVLIGTGVSAAVRNRIAGAGVPTIALPRLEIPDEIRQANLASDYHRHWAGVFEKLFIFSLCRFRKLVFLDSDMLVVRNIDDLFEKPHLSAVIADIGPDKPDSVDLNAGLMVIEPEPGLTDRLVAFLPEVFEREKRWRAAAGRPPSMGVQSTINLFWPEWITQRELHLDRKYNVLVDHLDYYIGSLGYRWRGPDGIRVLHFIGQVKPWMRTGTGFARWVARLVARRRVWELAACMAYLAVLGRARLHLGRSAR